MDIGFPQNYTNLYFIDVTPQSAARTWARVARGINDVQPNGNETVAQDPYYDGEGVSSSEVTGGQPVFSFAGHRVMGDKAQDYVNGLQLAYGEMRKSNFLWIAPDGTRIQGGCTIANIVSTGGGPNDKGTFSFEVQLNGRPSLTPGSATEMPESITCDAVTVKKGETAAAEATVTPEGASDSLVYAIDDETIATVDALGNVTGVEEGKCNLNIKSAVAPTVQKTVEVTVTAGA